MGLTTQGEEQQREITEAIPLGRLRIAPQFCDAARLRAGAGGDGAGCAHGRNEVPETLCVLLFVSTHLGPRVIWPHFL